MKQWYATIWNKLECWKFVRKSWSRGKMWITKVLTQKYFIMAKQGNYCFSWRPKTTTTTTLSRHCVIFWMERVTTSQMSAWILRDQKKVSSERVLRASNTKVKILLCWFTICVVKCMSHVFFWCLCVIWNDEKLDFPWNSALVLLFLVKIACFYGFLIAIMPHVLRKIWCVYTQVDIVLSHNYHNQLVWHGVYSLTLYFMYFMLIYILLIFWPKELKELWS